MVGYKFSLICLIVIYCAIKVQCEATVCDHQREQIPCDNSQCIDRDKWCDSFKDCDDESDEKYCKKSSFFSTPDNKCNAELHFTCDNRKCIPKVLRCDRYDDCKDGSDEYNCDSSETGISIAPGSPDRFDSTENSSGSESTYHRPSEVPPRQSITPFIHSYSPTEDYYNHRRAEVENSHKHRYNPATATASAYPINSVQQPTPVDNLYRQPGPGFPAREATTYPPAKEPCDKTISRPGDEGPEYRVPWSPFAFESSHGDSIKYQLDFYAKGALRWLMAQRNAELIWGENTPRALVALALGSDPAYNLAADDILQRRLRIELGAKLIKSREEPLSPSRLALYINALIATCQNPRDLFGRDLVEMLYQMVQMERARPLRMDASPFPYITLCLVNRPLSEEDHRFLQDIARRDITDEISKDKFILATSALACLKKNQPRSRDLDRSVDDAFYKLKQQQLNDGSFGSVYSTALAAQALLAIDSQSWNPQETLNYLANKQHGDGSFGDFLATYYALPVLNGKSLLHLRNIPCQSAPSPPSPNTTTTTTTTTTEPPPLTKNVRYILATEYRTIATKDIEVPVDTSFFEIMKEAQAEDQRYHFLSVEHDRKIDVYQINRIPNDPEFGMFWILYEGDSRDGRIDSKRRYIGDIRQLIPKNSDELIFLYKYFKPGSY